MTPSTASPDRSGTRASRRGLRAGVGIVLCAPAVAAIWLLLAAIPALADGGPHVSTINNGSLGINADSCAGCHRAHTAQGPFLLNAADEEALCLTCHGAAGTGSTVDVMTGVQYTLGGDGLRSGTILGATRNGGFDQARIGASEVYRISTATRSLRTKVPVLATAEDVTSAHLELAENGLNLPGFAWGNGPDLSGKGAAVEISCGSCHNPHGNGQYRILNPVPTATVTAADPFYPVAAPALVDDAPLPGPGDTRNYTVIQTVSTSPLLYASDVVAGGYPATAGDYFHRGVPWDTRTHNDAPNAQPSTFNAQITAWCSACHTRYYSEDDGTNPTPNDIFKYQHNTQSNRACTTCHVAHGSNAAMTADPRTGTTFAENFPYPGKKPIISNSSRLLKIDGRGTCQACHDPTGTFPASSSSGPVPVPYTP
jgi:predicted CXXCH cytochrome family protein